VAAAALLLGLALGSAPLFAQADDSSPERRFTLDDSEKLALLNSASLLAAEQGIVIAQQRVQQAETLFLPEIGLQASGTRYDDRYPTALAPELHSILLFPSPNDYIYSGRAYLTQTLYDGGKTINLLRLAQSTLKQAQTDYETVKMETLYGAKRVFYQLILAQEKRSAAQERLQTAQSRARGLAGWQRVEAEAVVSQLRTVAAEADHEVGMAGLDFRKQLNLELDTPFRVVGALEPKAVDLDLRKLIAWAMELRPELQSEIYKAQMSNIAINLASARRYPNLILASDYEITGPNTSLKQNNWDATLGLRIPIPFDFWSEVREKSAEKRQGEIMRAEIEDRVRLEVRRAYEEISFWQAEWPAREKDYLRLKSLADSAPPERGRLEPVRAQVPLLEARNRYLSAVAEDVLALSRLERAVGRSLSP